MVKGTRMILRFSLSTKQKFGTAFSLSLSSLSFLKTVLRFSCAIQAVTIQWTAESSVFRTASDSMYHPETYIVIGVTGWHLCSTSNFVSTFRHIPFYFPPWCLPFHLSLSLSVSHSHVYFCAWHLPEWIILYLMEWAHISSFRHLLIPLFLLRITRDSHARVLVSLSLSLLFSRCYLEGQRQCLEEHQPLNDQTSDGRPGPELVKQEE